MTAGRAEPREPPSGHAHQLQAGVPTWLGAAAVGNAQPDSPKDSTGQLCSLFHTSVVQGECRQHHSMEGKHPAPSSTEHSAPTRDLVHPAARS